VDAPYNQFDIFWKVNGQDIGERGGVEPGSALPAVEPYLDNLEPGRYSLNTVARADGRYLDNQSCGSLTLREEPDLSPEIGVNPADPEVLEAVTLEAEPAGDYSYSWDLNSDGQYERTGRDVTTEYESPGSKNVKLRISTENSEFETERTFEVENPEVSSALEVSKEEITPLEPVQINYEVGDAIAENGYSLQIKSPSGEKVLEVSESTTSGGREFVPSRDADKGTYRAKLIASEGFLSSIMRAVFGPEAEKDFEVIDAAGELDRWRKYCQENGFDPLTSSGRISCVKQLIGPECFKENPGQECIEIAESTCEYYVGTGFNPEAGRCGE
jgi:PKD repeat protein